MPLRFAWDEAKATSNRAKHQISFEEAATVFGDALSVTISDPAHSTPGEDRFITIGRSSTGRLLVVVHSDQEDHIRIISSRVATRKERTNYESTP